MRSLGLFNAKDTIVGDNSIRGVSGGERRRVTLGETGEGRGGKRRGEIDRRPCPLKRSYSEDHNTPQLNGSSSASRRVQVVGIRAILSAARHYTLLVHATHRLTNNVFRV